MRPIALVFVLLLSVSGTATAQEWEQFVSMEDRFQVNFPGEPTVTETTWTTGLEYVLPARVYSAEGARGRYSVTVVDYSGLEQLGVARAATCESGNQQCRQNENNTTLGSGYWMHDERGAIVYATFRLIQQAEEVTQLAWEWQDLVEGHLLNLTNTDGSRTLAYVTMHEHKLYIMEGTVPMGYPSPGLFQQSLGWIDEDGNGIRYEVLYSNSYHGMGIYPKPPVRTVAAAAGAAAAAPAATGR